MKRFKHKLEVRVNEQDYKILQEFSCKKGMPKAYIIRIALQNYFSRKGFYNENR